MNYILIASDKNQTDTVLLKQISEDCCLKITQVQSKNKPIPHFEFTYVKCLEHEFDSIYRVISDLEEVERIESQMLSGFNSLFSQFIV